MPVNRHPATPSAVKEPDMSYPKPRGDEWYRARLSPPSGRCQVVIDTDAANEIDDQFALAWALLSPETIEIKAVYAAPFSFAHRRAMYPLIDP